MGNSNQIPRSYSINNPNQPVELQPKKSCKDICVELHSKKGQNCPFLLDRNFEHHLDYIQYKYNINDPWQVITDDVWKNICSGINYSLPPRELYNNLLNVYGYNPQTYNRGVMLRYIMDDGSVVERNDDYVGTWLQREVVYTKLNCV